MTRKEAIKAIEWYMVYIRDDFGLAPMPWFVAKALDMAIEALSAEAVQEAVPTVVRVTMSDGSQYYLETERE